MEREEGEERERRIKRNTSGKNLTKPEEPYGQMIPTFTQKKFGEEEMKFEIPEISLWVRDVEPNPQI